MSALRNRSGESSTIPLESSETLARLKEGARRHHKLVLFEPTCREIMFNDNPFLLTGYREHTEGSWKKCLFSLFTLHNDTLNVWTHLLPGLIFLFLIYQTNTQAPLANLPLDDVLAFSSFLLLSSCCLITSAIYHLFRTHSVEAYVALLTCDIIGITFQVFGSTFLLVFFEMNCYPWWRNVYLAYLCSLAVFTALYVPFLVRSRKTSLRTFLLVCFALTGLLCWSHHFFLAGGHWNEHNTSTLLHLLCTYAWVGSGLIIRRLRVPEVLAPGTFDVWFHSHQIFHVASALGSYTLFLGYYKLGAAEILNTCGENEFFF